MLWFFKNKQCIISEQNPSRFCVREKKSVKTWCFHSQIRTPDYTVALLKITPQKPMLREYGFVTGSVKPCVAVRSMRF